jgi:hypothetical protein
MIMKLALPIMLLVVLPVSCTPATNIPVTQQDYVFTLSQEPEDLSGVSVAIYEGYIDYYDQRVNQSLIALTHMFEWMNATVHVFNHTQIIDGALFSCELLAVPEGLGPRLENRLTDDGLQAIKDWLALGGSYVGVRGSAAMAVKDSYFEGVTTEFGLALINGCSYEVEDLPDLTMTNVSINHDSTGPDLSDMPENLTVLFRTGRYIIPYEGQELIYIANYTHSNLPAMVASFYGEGTVFISSPHFEYEEDSPRDGTDYMDSYEDPDSEWPFLLTICQWLIASSPTVRNTTWVTSDHLGFPIGTEILVVSAIGVVAIVALVVLLKRKQ